MFCKQEGNYIKSDLFSSRLHDIFIVSNNELSYAIAQFSDSFQNEFLIAVEAISGSVRDFIRNRKSLHFERFLEFEGARSGL